MCQTCFPCRYPLLRFESLLTGLQMLKEMETLSPLLCKRSASTYLPRSLRRTNSRFLVALHPLHRKLPDLIR